MDNHFNWGSCVMATVTMITQTVVVHPLKVKFSQCQRCAASILTYGNQKDDPQGDAGSTTD